MFWVGFFLVTWHDDALLFKLISELGIFFMIDILSLIVNLIA